MNNINKLNIVKVSAFIEISIKIEIWTIFLGKLRGHLGLDSRTKMGSGVQALDWNSPVVSRILIVDTEDSISRPKSQYQWWRVL